MRSFLVPTVLIAYGSSIIKNNGIYSSYKIQKDISKTFPGFSTQVDDYIQYASYAGLISIGLWQINKPGWQNIAVKVIKSELVMGTLVYGLKYTTDVKRPDSGSPNSFPSGHTAQLFVAAALLDKELKGKKTGLVAGAYTLAAAVGLLRILNNRHWASDVLAGAGIGMLSVQVVYLTHKNKWGKQSLSLHPFISPNAKGVQLTYQF